MRVYQTESIILRRDNFLEADKILTIFTKHFGKKRVLARGVRKITSRRAGSLELFNLVKIGLAKGRSFDIVTEAETIDSFKIWRKNLIKISFAYHYCELVERLTAEESPNREIFDLLVDKLQNLGTSLDERLAFEKKILEACGFWPKDKPIDNIDMHAYLEKIIEKKLRSLSLLNKIS